MLGGLVFMINVDQVEDCEGERDQTWVGLWIMRRWKVDIWDVIWIDHWKDQIYVGWRLRVIVGGDKDGHADQGDDFCWW